MALLPGDDPMRVSSMVSRSEAEDVRASYAGSVPYEPHRAAAPHESPTRRTRTPPLGGGAHARPLVPHAHPGRLHAPSDADGMPHSAPGAQGAPGGRARWAFGDAPPPTSGWGGARAEYQGRSAHARGPLDVHGYPTPPPDVQGYPVATDGPSYAAPHLQRFDERHPPPMHARRRVSPPLDADGAGRFSGAMRPLSPPPRRVGMGDAYAMHPPFAAPTGDGAQRLPRKLSPPGAPWGDGSARGQHMHEHALPGHAYERAPPHFARDAAHAAHPQEQPPPRVHAPDRARVVSPGAQRMPFLKDARVRHAEEPGDHGRPPPHYAAQDTFVGNMRTDTDERLDSAARPAGGVRGAVGGAEGAAGGDGMGGGARGGEADLRERMPRPAIPHHHHVVPHHHHVVPHHHHHHHHVHHHHSHHCSPTRDSVPGAPDGHAVPRSPPLPDGWGGEGRWGDWRGGDGRTSFLPQDAHTPAGRPADHYGPLLSPLEQKLHDLASGLRVDSEPVWQYLDRCEQMEEELREATQDRAPKRRASEPSPEYGGERERHSPPGARSPPSGAPLLSSLVRAPGVVDKWRSASSSDPRMVLGGGLGLDRGRAVRHLGAFMYDPTRVTLPAELLVANIGATVEVRISGRFLGPGIGEDVWRGESARIRAQAHAHLREYPESTAPPTAGAPPALSGTGAPGHWSLGWRGREHTRINSELRMVSTWTDCRLQLETNKRLRRSAPSAPPRVHVTPRAAPRTDAADAAWRFWEQPGLLQRRLWGTDVYTDDSDVLAMCVHAGWIEAPPIPDVPEWLSGGGSSQVARAWEGLSAEDAHPRERAPPPRAEAATCDLSVTLRIAPKLILYKGSHRGGIRSRSWGNTHDGVSLVVESVELKPAGYAACTGRHAAKTRVAHMAELRRHARAAPPPRALADEGASDGLAVSLADVATGRAGERRPFWDVPVGR
ncbi:hypothetical protein MSPP1_000957 [Malassezia sp. CBS 17886]|nr:hypothetical protein MSPP1_000957 [Malassezia sp. CBS 17886]